MPYIGKTFWSQTFSAGTSYPVDSFTDPVEVQRLKIEIPRPHAFNKANHFARSVYESLSRHKNSQAFFSDVVVDKLHYFARIASRRIVLRSVILRSGICQASNTTTKRRRSLFLSKLKKRTATLSNLSKSKNRTPQ